ncbi:uncharacterized protein LOC144866805 [Branchiostoma floridae x Branchiostoma japonicum]
MAATGMLHLQFPGQEHAVLSQLNTMRLQSQLCDVTVWAGGQKFHCHQAVLAASSGHFHSIFVQGVLCFPKKPTNETLDLSFISAEVFSIILDYIYTANIHCPTGIVADVLQAAKTLEIEPLTTQLPAFVGGATPISGLNNTSVPNVSVEKPPPSSITSSVGGSKLNVPSSLAEMLSEPEENTDQPAGQSAMEDVVVKQEPLYPLEASQDLLSSPSTSLPPIPHLSTDDGEEEEDLEMMSWTRWINDESSRRLGAEEIAELEENCRRCARKDNSVRCCIRTLKEWCLSRNKPVDFETLPGDQLCRLLQQFYYEVRNPDGRHYGAQTMLGFRSAIKTYLLHHPAQPNFNIVTDTAFSAANKTLLKVVKDCPIGFEAKFGIKAISFPDLQKLFSTGTLSTSTPTSLQRLVWFYFTIHFHIKTMDEWLMLRKKDLTLHKQGKNNAYFTLGGPGRKGERLEDRMYAAGGRLCPVAVTKFYLKKLNVQCQSLLQKPVRGRLFHGRGRWYKDHVPGQNYITAMMKNISIDAGLSLTYTNNRIRKTTRQDLNFAGVFSSSSSITSEVVNQLMASFGPSQFETYNHSAPVTAASEAVTQPVAPLGVSQVKMPVIEINTSLGAAILRHGPEQSQGMATPPSQQVGGTLGSFEQLPGLPGGFAEETNGQQAHLDINQGSVMAATTQNSAIGLQRRLADSVHGDLNDLLFDPESTMKKRPMKGVRRSTRKRKCEFLLKEEEDDDDDDWIPG